MKLGSCIVIPLERFTTGEEISPEHKVDLPSDANVHACYARDEGLCLTYTYSSDKVTVRTLRFVRDGEKPEGDFVSCLRINGEEFAAFMGTDHKRNWRRISRDRVWRYSLNLARLKTFGTHMDDMGDIMGAGDEVDTLTRHYMSLLEYEALGVLREAGDTGCNDL